VPGTEREREKGRERKGERERERETERERERERGRERERAILVHAERFLSISIENAFDREHILSLENTFYL